MTIYAPGERVNLDYVTHTCHSPLPGAPPNRERWMVISPDGAPVVVDLPHDKEDLPADGDQPSAWPCAEWYWLGPALWSNGTTPDGREWYWIQVIVGEMLLSSGRMTAGRRTIDEPIQQPRERALREIGEAFARALNKADVHAYLTKVGGYF